jgi:hypothetical protein
MVRDAEIAPEQPQEAGCEALGRTQREVEDEAKRQHERDGRVCCIIAYCSLPSADFARNRPEALHAAYPLSECRGASGHLNGWRFAHHTAGRVPPAGIRHSPYVPQPRSCRSVGVAGGAVPTASGSDLLI